MIKCEYLNYSLYSKDYAPELYLFDRLKGGNES